MNSKPSVWFFSAVVVFFLTGQAWAQEKKMNGINVSTAGRDTLFENYDFRFPHLYEGGVELRYYNPKALSKIARLEKKEKWEQVLPLLEDYVGKFRIGNFYKDTQLLWRLGQLYERLGQVGKAKAIYRLTLKHHRGAITRIKLHYDSLTELDRDYFIPLDYYYELVEYRKTIDTLRPPRGVLLNMGDVVNSYSDDYAPTLNAANDVLLFSSKRNQKGVLQKTVNEDIFISRKDEFGWSEAEPFTDINSPYNEGSAVLSPDGANLYFVRCESREGYGDCDIFVADRQEDGSYGNIRNLGPSVNSQGWDSQPALSHSGDTLYFASDRLGGFGLSDIYYTVRKRGGLWSPARNLGPVINTRNSEVSPFIHHKHNVLYFSSNGHLVNFGNFDIYKSYYRRGRWTEPRNIGPLVNGIGSENYFTIDSESKNLFYARSEDQMNNLDLFSFPLPMGAQPLADTRLSGILTDSVTGKPFGGIVSIVDLDNGIEVAPKALRKDGSFDFDLINNNNYLLIIQGEEFFRIEQQFRLNGDTLIKAKAESILSKKIRFTSIEFEQGKADILMDMYSDLDALYDFLIDNPAFGLKISGHTDSVGDREKNQDLSQRRAEAIKLYLIADGRIDPDRIEAIGYGSERPIVTPERTEEDRRTNRRVEFQLIPLGN
ncbi:WD40-like Beta Propeller Repeat [Catalinimonas alkaloidigena]|uniref:WD40-like Beta Propeller Repeat n=2 Tax=Catalinimonas alkaloidigena TaxID=1075417 RepID=A0A1G9LJ80_9BACT|nr:WD40-like Beta Propeller Repeat [Catalinimonas alkaloidigena]